MSGTRWLSAMGAAVATTSSSAVVYSSTLTALAAEPVYFPLMGRVTIVGPLLPTDVQLLGQKSLLCQLQSRLGGKLSVVAPAVCHDFLVFGQKRSELFQIFQRRT